jgi:hypothetical protein
MLPGRATLLAARQTISLRTISSLKALVNHEIYSFSARICGIAVPSRQGQLRVSGFASIRFVELSMYQRSHRECRV